jgi:hypothetical protein
MARCSIWPFQQYLAKKPDGYRPNHSCGIPYKFAVLYSAEEA